MAKADDDNEGAPSRAPDGGGARKLIIFAGIGLAFVGITIGSVFFLMKSMLAQLPAGPGAATSADAKHAPAKDDKPKSSFYAPLDPAFVVNFEDGGRMRYLQLTIEVLTTDEAVKEDIKKHMPLIRNNLVMLLSGQTPAGLAGREGKERLRHEALAEVRRIMEQQTGKPVVEDLYFTSFVMQ